VIEAEAENIEAHYKSNMNGQKSLSSIAATLKQSVPLAESQVLDSAGEL
jgi:hypothetical protein